MKDVSLAQIVEALHAWDDQASVLKDRLDLATERETALMREVTDAASALAGALGVPTQKLRDLVTMVAGAMATHQYHVDAINVCESRVAELTRQKGQLEDEVREATEWLHTALGPTSTPRTLRDTVTAAVEMMEQAKEMIRRGL